jgi:hypothetical protein
MSGIQNGIRQQPNQQPNKIEIKHTSQTNNPDFRLTCVSIVEWHLAQIH